MPFLPLIHGLCASFGVLLTPFSTAPSPPPSQFTVCTSRSARLRLRLSVLYFVRVVCVCVCGAFRVTIIFNLNWSARCTATLKGVYLQIVFHFLQQTMVFSEGMVHDIQHAPRTATRFDVLLDQELTLLNTPAYCRDVCLGLSPCPGLLRFCIGSEQGKLVKREWCCPCQTQQNPWKEGDNKKFKFVQNETLEAAININKTQSKGKLPPLLQHKEK